MRTANLYAAAALLLASPCTAWPEKVDELWGLAERAITELAPRQQSTTYNLSPSLVQGNTATTVTGSATATGSGAVVTGGGNNTATATNSGNGNATSTSQTEFDPRLPPGGVNLITPNTALAVPTYYKIDDWVTFAWNYTSLLATPTAVDILASCAQNQATYTIALNQSLPSGGAAQTVLWDTNAYQANATVPLLTATYTLIIHDADEPISARASAGYLSTFNQYYFGMYVPQSPTPYDQYVCVTCSGAMTAAERQTIYTILGVAGITVASFTWFTGVAGLW